MSKQLIIAEKPSVAQDIARALAATGEKFERHGDYYESEHYVLSSAIGHLLELAEPPEYEVKRGKWTFAHLPVIPPHFALKPIEKTVDRLNTLVRLIRRKDVAAVINACDAGREGELIFRYIMQHASCDKPIRRLWLQSMTPQAIREGFAHLRSNEEMLPLADAARCRSEADWLIGINGTRAMTAFNSQEGGFYKTTVGRVQTPTLAILIEREKARRAHRPRDYWEIEAEFQAAAGSYKGRWFNENFAKSDDPEAKAERLWDAAQAEAIRKKCLGQHGEATDEATPKSESCPLLFDLTSLQREANARFGFSARTTLQLAQALYEKHKALTYPRTDSRYLPEDMVPAVKETLAALRPLPIGQHAVTVLEKGWVIPTKRIFNDAKVSDHFAIIPTGTLPKHLSDAEQKLFDLVVKRFVAIFFPPAEYLVTTRITRVAGEAFKSVGKVLVKPGWLVVHGKEAPPDEEAASLPPLEKNERVFALDVAIKALQTKPPARYTEATLLAAMEGAGKFVEDEELRAAMAERGLGTPATRAQIIEGLIEEGYVHREGKELVPTAKAFNLLFALEQLKVDEIRSPELTGLWEWKLRQMEQGRLSRDEFMHHIVEQTREMVERIKNGEFHDADFGELASPCPKCGGKLKETYRHFRCERCDYRLWKVLAGRPWEPAEIDTLLREGQIGPLSGFRSKQGRAFSALVRLNEEAQPAFDFGEAQADAEEAVDFSGQEALGPCPKCGARVFELGAAYVCEEAVGQNKRCDFRSGKVILQQEIPREEMQKLLLAGRSSLLKGFVSNRTRRKFAAYLVRLADGSIGFEFEQKAAHEKGKPAATAQGKGALRKSAS
ncbi:MAG: DNA topoisomerase III [Rhodocyclaceae bacterium]|nr:DNA topoisomerase III [Rhodocyclaceae bacterium]